MGEVCVKFTCNVWSFALCRNGPVGSALCVYPADNSVESSAGAPYTSHITSFMSPIICRVLTGAGRTKSVFDIFREDVVNDVESTPVENTFLEVWGSHIVIPAHESSHSIACCRNQN